MKKIIILTISLLFGVIIGSSIQKNYTPEKVVIEKDSVYINDTVFVEEIIPLSEKGVLVELIKQEVPHPYIVLAQSKLETGNYKSKLVSQIHDELILKVYDDEKDIIYPLVKNIMENCVKLKVSLKADGGYAKNWYLAK